MAFWPMTRRVSQIWMAWILAVTQLGFAVGGDLLHSLNHQIAAAHDKIHGGNIHSGHAHDDAAGNNHEDGCCCHVSQSVKETNSYTAPVNGFTKSGTNPSPSKSTNQPETSSQRSSKSWNAPLDHHLCFSSECRFVRITSQQGLHDFVTHAILESINLIVSQEIKSQRYSLGTLKTISSRGPPAQSCC